MPDRTMPDRRPFAPTFSELLAVQEGVFARWQECIDAPTRHLIRSQVRARRWQLWSPRVVVASNGALTPVQLRWAALLHCGQDAVLCDATAAELGGLRGYESSEVHVSVPRGAHVVAPSGVLLHWRRDRPVDPQPARQPRRDRIRIALVDMTGSTRDPRRACAVLAAGVQQRLVLASALRAEIDRRARARHKQLLLNVLGDIDGGAHALGEINFAQLCRKYGLPPPTRQTIRRDRRGRRRYLDVYWDEWHLVVEIDGAAHMEVEAWWADMSRQNGIVLGANRVLRFPSAVLRIDPAVVMDEVTAGLIQGGWRPGIRP
ncbi:MAG: hypothetical protein ABR520_08800 [Mycobacteriales bacterium]|nr:endonuclease domain-containing protein [Frankia sp.]